jgi:hypothetical protein
LLSKRGAIVKDAKMGVCAIAHTLAFSMRVTQNDASDWQFIPNVLAFEFQSIRRTHYFSSRLKPYKSATLQRSVRATANSHSARDIGAIREFHYMCGLEQIECAPAFIM